MDDGGLSKSESFKLFSAKYVWVGKNWGLLGDGGCSIVKLAACKENADEVAVKIIDKKKYNTTCNVKELEKEVSILRELTVRNSGGKNEAVHPNIVYLKDMYECPDFMLIIMPRGGLTLFDYLCEQKSLSEVMVTSIVSQILSGLKYLHEHNIGHGDIKLDNILFQCGDGKSGLSPVKIMIVDFGSSFKLVGKAEGCSYNTVLSRLETPAANKMGTTGYRAPELYREEGFNERIDIFATGVVAYTLLCGFPPFVSDPSFRNDEAFNCYPFWFFMNANTHELRSQTEFAQVSFPDKFWGNISAPAKESIAFMLEKIPHRRESASDLLERQWMEEFKQAIQEVSNRSKLFNKFEKIGMGSKSLISSRIEMLQEADSSPNSKGRSKDTFMRVSSGSANVRTRVLRRMSNEDIGQIHKAGKENETGPIFESIGKHFPGYTHTRTKTVSDTRSLYQKPTKPFSTSFDVAPAQ
eukprot:Nk52_evm35s240 gene=Nk52_evmTU35s240